MRLRNVRILGWLAVFSLGLALAGFGSITVLYFIYRHDVPQVLSAQDYRPPLKSKVFAQNGELLAEYGINERVIVPEDQMPKLVKQAFVAAEDKNFYSHYGIDFAGIINAVLQKISGQRATLRGASTITQQLAKSLLIKEEGYDQATARTISRKIKEAILARRLEENLSKDEILWMYLNEVYLGQSSYGVAAAARTYFHKNLNNISLSEIAILAGLPQAPSRFSPNGNMEKAELRQAYVLKRMLDDKYISQAEYDKALKDNKGLKVYEKENTFRKSAPYLAENIRRELISIYGEDRLYNDGLNIYTTINLDHQRLMTQVLQQGLMKIDKRQGFLWPIYKASPDERAMVKKLVQKINQEKLLALPELYFLAMVEKIDRAHAISITMGDEQGRIPWALAAWAHKNINDLKSGDVVLVKKVFDGVFSLEQEPKVEGAMFSIEPSSGYITALSGGYSFDKSEFNRVTQACRQPGSLFKPIVYSAAIALKKYTPATMVTDAPLTFYNGEDGIWKPKNLGGEYKGEVTMREALMNSMNVPTINIMADVGAKNVLDWAKKLGVTTPLKAELGTAIGSSCVTPWEMGQVFSLIANLGIKKEPYLIKEVTDRDQKRLSFKADITDPWITHDDRLETIFNSFANENTRVMSEEDAYTTHYLLTEVVKNGTARRAQELGRHLAGKTGTTNDSFDTWFSGYTKNLLSVVWVGYDNMETPLAAHEQGGRTALPLFIDFMKGALHHLPDEDWPMPSSMCWANIDKSTGLRVDFAHPMSFTAPFHCGLEPPLMESLPFRLEQAMDMGGM